MKPQILFLLAAVLAGCQREPPVAQAPPPASTPPATELPVADIADWQGYGPLQLGIDAEQVALAWDAPLQGEAVADGGCYYLQADSAPGVVFMVEHGQFVRYDVDSQTQLAPGGGHNGMPLDRLQALYPVAEPPRPHKHEAGAQVLRVPATDGSQAALVFEIGADGKARTWRLGLPPQVDYVERCG